MDGYSKALRLRTQQKPRQRKPRTRSPHMFTLLTLAFVGLANAATPANMADVDGDGFLAFVGTATAASTGYLGALDCDDTDATVYPGGLPEAVGSTTYCNSSGVISNLPGTYDVYKTFVSAEYGGHTPGFQTYSEENSNCLAGVGDSTVDPPVPTTCTVNSADGTFDTADSHVLVNAVVDGTRLFHRGMPISRWDTRDLLDREFASHAPIAKPRAGMSRRGVNLIVDGLRKEVVADNVLRDGRITSNEERLKAIDLGNSARDEVINANSEQIEWNRHEASYATYLATEAYVQSHENKGGVKEAKAHGPLFEAGVVFSGLSRTPLERTDNNGDLTGELVRDSGLRSAGLELRSGVDGEGYEFVGFGQVSFGKDGYGVGADMVYTLGVEAMWELGGSSVALGPWVAYIHTNDMADGLSAGVGEDGALLGATISMDTLKGPARLDPYLRVAAGYGTYDAEGWVDGAPVVEPGSGRMLILQLGVRGGVASLTR
jgi:hypothetical protein